MTILLLLCILGSLLFITICLLAFLLKCSFIGIKHLSSCADSLQQILEKRPKPHVNDNPDEVDLVHRDRPHLFMKKVSEWAGRDS